MTKPEIIALPGTGSIRFALTQSHSFCHSNVIISGLGKAKISGF
jgi:hypothetical protein